MNIHNERQAYDLRCKAEAIVAREELVQIELSTTAAWLLRDIIGLKHVGLQDLSLSEDMLRLNDVLGYRPSPLGRNFPAPHVAGWTQKIVEGITTR